MMCLRNALPVVVVALFWAAAADAQEPIRFGRTPDISPDGNLVAFSYLGDIWVVESIGGIARPVTMHEAHDISPVFSPDGRYIAFSSNRHGSYDVFVVPAVGGKPRRLTFDSAADFVNGWAPDGKAVLFTSSRGTAYPQRYELYTVPAEGGRERKLTAFEGKDGTFAPKGDSLAYVRGPGTWYRKGYRGSSNDDIWLCDADGGNNRRLTEFDCQDTSPMWGPDGQTLYYVSEFFGTPANIVRQEIGDRGKKPQPLTFHKDDAVRKARISGNGDWIVYECGTDLWVVSTHEGTPPRRLAIEVHADDKANTERTETFTRGASEFALARDDRHVAFVVHGEIFLMPTSGGKATRLTDSPAYDHSIAWSPDSKKIIFASDRGGHEDLYLLEPDDKENPSLVKAHKFKYTRLTDTQEAEVGPNFSPDGKRVAFLRAGQLWTMKPDGTDQKALVKDVQVIDYEWSPDSKWLAFSRTDGSLASEMYLIPATGGAARNVTRYATYNAGITWGGGKGDTIAFLSHRRGSTGLYVLSLQKPAAEGTPDSKDIDWDDIHKRVVQPAPLPVQEGAISRDGAKVAFRAATSSGDDLWVASTNGGSLTRLTFSNARPRHIQWSRYPELIYYLDATGTIRSARAVMGSSLMGLGMSPAAPSGGIAFRAKLTVRRDEEFQEMFEQSWRALR